MDPVTLGEADIVGHTTSPGPPDKGEKSNVGSTCLLSYFSDGMKPQYLKTHFAVYDF